jgi:serine/threonine-protein kinase
MGEVYRAKDTRLGRDVAVKILPKEMSADLARKQRFEREAKTISGLNHPNICVLHDVGSQDGVDYLVMECVEGETLARRLEKGPLPLEQVLKYGAQIADALDKAHRAGIVHRDLKPGNIMLTSTGVKLLDFGLAKPVEGVVSGLTLSVAAVRSSPVTQEGMVVGTFQYMSPEQVEGKELDGRSDIFSLGAVLYEMLTGLRAFEGKSQLSVASAILEKEPAAISEIKPMTLPALDHVIRRCLAKDPEERWQTARDLAIELKAISNEGPHTAKAPAAATTRSSERWAWGAASALGLVAAALAVGFIQRAPKPEPTVRLTADMGADVKLYDDRGISAVLSPNGARLAFVGMGPDEKWHIYVRSLDQLQATMLSGTEDATNPFFSPDSEWLGFFANAKLKKIAVQGGASVTLCDALDARGGAWSEHGTLVFAPGPRTALLKVSAAGGPSQPMTTLDQQANEATERWPQFLPGGDAVLFTSDTHGGNYEDADIVVYSISSGKRHTLLRGGYYGRFVSTGHIVYMHEGTMFAVPFDRKGLEVTGSPSPILEGIIANPGDATMQVSFAENGTLMYVPGHGGFRLASIYWMDRAGKFTPVRETPGNYYMPALSPDGKRLALAINDGKKSDVWVLDLARDTLMRLTFDGYNVGPIWTPGGERITYEHLGPGAGDLYWTRADGTGTPLRLTSVSGRVYPASWHPDGKVLTLEQGSVGSEDRGLATGLGQSSTLMMTIEGNDKQGWKPGELRPLLTGSYNAWDSSFSPDGRWLAYASNESGDFEVYVRPFPGPGGKWQISTGGGRYPKWSRTTKELFYRTFDSKIMVAPYTVTGDSFTAGKAQLWSTGQFTERLGSVNFDIHPDGKRFVVLKTPPSKEGSATSRFTFVFNFFDELRRKVPSPK